MSKGWTVNRKLMVGFSAMLGLVLVAGGVAWWSSDTIRKSGKLTAQAANRVQLAGEIQEINAKIFGAEKNMILGGILDNRELLEAWTPRLQEYIDLGQVRAKELYDQMNDDSERRLAASLQEKMKLYADRCDACHEVAAELKTRPDKVLALSAAGEALMQSNHDLAEQIRMAQVATYKVEIDAADSTYQWARAFSTAIVIVCLLVGGVVVVTIRRVSQKLALAASRLRLGAEQMRGSSTQVSSSAQSLAQGATEQAASLEETSASMEEMTAMTRQNADHTRSALGLVAETDSHVQRSNSALAEMTVSMNSIRESSGRVSKIIKTIEQIAFQTNILALNAAVEAARAGEAGMGFAVVAEEVRSLAQRSSTAARDTTELIEASIAASADGARKVELVADAIKAVTSNVQQVKALVSKVSNANQQQSVGISQVAQAIEQMEQVTQRTAATAEESAAASEELNTEVDHVVAEAEALEAMVGGSAQGVEQIAETAEEPDLCGERQDRGAVSEFDEYVAPPTQSPLRIPPINRGLRGLALLP
jgi:methyl-accepting chemotaxis protein/methyl-accepting chemotaxis protein-1 (serine sensor receptor)